MIIDIVTDPPKLIIPSYKTPTNELEKVIQDMLDTARANSKNCLGLSSNQVGSLEPVFLIKDLSTAAQYEIIINPKIISLGGGIKGARERCLSIPDSMKRGILKRRYKFITIEYIMWRTTTKIKRKFINLSARIVQHELDHLKGILI